MSKTFGEESFLRCRVPRERLRRGAVATVALAAAAAMVAISAGASGATVTASAAASAGRPARSKFLPTATPRTPSRSGRLQQYNNTSMGHKVKAVLTTIPGANYQTKLQTIMSTSSAPDVFFNWGGGSILQFQKAGLLLPLNSFFQKNPKLKSSFLPSILDAAKIGNNYYGIPMRGTQPVMLFYNKALLKQDKVPVPKTFPQLLSDVKALSKARASASRSRSAAVTSGRR